MGKNNILYDRNHPKKRNDNLDLYVTGNLPDGRPSKPYEGRLQIHNNIGSCQAELIEGTLPEGGNVYVDNTTYEVVVAWPGYKEEIIPLVNPSFETGDLTGWSYTTVGGSGTLEVTGNNSISGQYTAYWAGGKGLGSEGGIECLAVNDVSADIIPGQEVHGSFNTMYNPGGGTPKGSRNQARLHWLKSDGTLLSDTQGYLVKTRAFNGRWILSDVTGKAPVGASKVKLACWSTATGAGHSYFDDAKWDMVGSVGINHPEILHLKIKVTDSAGRIAYWEGDLNIKYWSGEFELVYTTPTTNSFQGIGWSKNIGMVAASGVNGAGGAGGVEAYSTDGLNWSEVSNSSWGRVFVSESEGLFIDGGYNSSRNGLPRYFNNSLIFAPITFDDFNAGIDTKSIIEGPNENEWYAMGTLAALYKSNNFINWIHYTNYSGGFNCIDYCRAWNKFIGITSTTPRLVQSTDAINFTDIGMSVNSGYNKARWFNILNKFVAVSVSGSVLISEDGLNFVETSLSGSFTDVAYDYNNDIILVTGTKSYFSLDKGLSWTLITTLPIIVGNTGCTYSGELGMFIVGSLRNIYIAKTG